MQGEKLSKEEVRLARLRALGLSTGEGGNSRDMSDSPAEKKERRSFNESYLPDNVLGEIKNLIISRDTYPEDIARWLSQGCQFISAPNYCLKQSHGGPCGILAVLQAEIIKCLYFQDSSSSSGGLLESVEADRRTHVFARALFEIFNRAANDGAVHMVLFQGSMLITIYVLYIPRLGLL
jgi:hypothetical protein